jgi:HD superfamily phosphodiesterase
MLTSKQKKSIESFVKKSLDPLNWMHVNGVRPIAQYIAKKEGADKEIVDVSVLFHDITKTNLKTELYHHIEGADIAKKFLKKLKLSKEFIDAVYHCVISHSTPLRYFKSKAKKAHKSKNFLPEPKTMEAKVLFDADMIQQISPYGITKGLFIQYITYKKPFKEGFLSIKNTLMNDAAKTLFTKTAKKLSKERLKYLKEFFKKLENE